LKNIGKSTKPLIQGKLLNGGHSMRGLLIFALPMALACQPSRDERQTEAPSESRSESGIYVERANEAMRSLQSGLVGALTAAMKEGGAPAAVHVCRDEAQIITQRVAEETGVLVGRTSDRLRNPVNAPRPWAQDLVEQAAGKKSGEVEMQVIDLGDRIGVIKPINTLGLCTNCHGSNIDPEVGRALADAYPDDRAVGFETGDLRGWMWAEVPK
jgi:hypothetical protein